jgi:four helix bundle protein
MRIFRFLEWSVYKEAKELFQIIHKLISKLPNNVKIDLGSQILRSAFSIILNIAEGSGKSSDKELNRFFDIAIGSLNETVAGIDVLRDNSFVSHEDFMLVKQKAESISKQLGGFKKTLS